MDTFPGMPPIVSTHGSEMAQLMWYVHILMGLLFVGWIAYFGYVVFRYRAKRNPKANYEGSKGKFAKKLEILVAVIEGVLLVAFSIPMYSERVDALPPESDAIVIDLIAEQFAWNLHYPGEDGIFGKRDIEKIDETNAIGLDRSSPGGADDIVTINQLHVPYGKPVIIRLTSKDVIHCFNLPVMYVKQDIIPGMRIPIWFEATGPIKSEITCAQLCGLGHYRMKGFLTVESMEAYQAWLAEEATYIVGEDEEAW